MDRQIAFEWLHLAEYGLYESTLSDAILTHDTDAISLREECLTDIEEWFAATDEDILDFYQVLSSELVIWEVELHSYADFRTLDEFYFIELFFSAFGESCP